jgi:hypothetical protein
MAHPRIQYSNYQTQLDHINNNMIHLNTRMIESEKKREAFETAVKQYAIVGIFGLGVAILVYQNADAIKPHLQSIGNLSMADVQKAAGNGWKETTLLFEKSTKYLSNMLRF